MSFVSQSTYVPAPLQTLMCLESIRLFVLHRPPSPTNNQILSSNAPLPTRIEIKTFEPNHSTKATLIAPTLFVLLSWQRFVHLFHRPVDAGNDGPSKIFNLWSFNHRTEIEILPIHDDSLSLPVLPWPTNQTGHAPKKCLRSHGNGAIRLRLYYPRYRWKQNKPCPCLAIPPLWSLRCTFLGRTIQKVAPNMLDFHVKSKKTEAMLLTGPFVCCPKAIWRQCTRLPAFFSPPVLLSKLF